ncbi:MAG TPA: hypothetical protein VI299_28035 [Polyangiales bacterium]
MDVRGGFTRTLLSVALVLLASRARAGNDDSILLGNDAALVAGAVVSNSNDGSALWYNPAGLARVGQDSVDVGASAFALRRYKMPGLISAAGGQGGDASFTEIVSIPSALTYVRRWGSSVAGLGLFASQVADYTLRASLGVPIAAIIDGRIRVLLNQESARYHLAGGWGVRLPRGFAVGASLFGDYYDDTQFGQVSGAYSASGTPVGVSVSSSYTQAKALGFHVRMGMTYDARPDLRFGLSVETPGVYFYRSGRETSIETQTAVDNQGQFQLMTNSVDTSKTQGGFGLYAPLRVRMGGSADFAGASWAFEGDVQSKVKDRGIDVDRKFVWNLRAGARWSVSDTLRLGAGLFTDRGSDRTDSWGAGNLDFYGATLGGQYETVRWIASEGAAGEKKAGITFSSTLALRYAYGFGKLPGQYLDADLNAQTRAVDIRVSEFTVHLGSGVYF